MSLSADALERVWNVVREKTEAGNEGEWQKHFRFGLRRGLQATIFLWAFRLISDRMDILAMFSIGGFALLYVATRKVNPFWVPLGMTAGVFVSCTLLIPIVIGFEKMWVKIAWFFSEIHAAGDSMFLGSRTTFGLPASVGMLVLVPYGIKQAKAAWRAFKTGRREWADKMWAKQEMIPHYEGGMLFLSDRNSLTVAERDAIAEYWGNLTSDEIRDHAFLIATRGQISQAHALDDVRIIHERALMRIQSGRYQVRHKKD